MTVHSAEQSVHDKINLGCLVRRLEASLLDENWNNYSEYDAWIKAQGTLQKIKYTRKLLKNVEMYEESPLPKTLQRYRDMEVTLDRVESFALAIEKKSAPPKSKPAPLLPRLPIPSSSAVGQQADGSRSSEVNVPRNVPSRLPVDNLLLPSDPSALPLASANLLLSPDTPRLPMTPAQPPKPAAVAATSKVSPHNSNALQQELADQLAQMATQLKRNAIHFSESLVQDKAVIEDAQIKVEGNYTMMTKERVRLRDHRGKSGSTTCLVLMSILVVAISFVLMFFVIRVT